MRTKVCHRSSLSESSTERYLCCDGEPTRYVDRGRRNLAAATITLMRAIGMNAFQTTLLPHLTPQDIKRLNHLDHLTLANEGLTVQLELDRVFAIAEPVTSTASGRLH